jgi:sugar lactone lactonase YvrE
MTRISIVLALGCQFIVVAAQAAEMQYPMSAAAGPDGAIYVADNHAHSVWKIADGKLEAYFQGSNKFRTPLNAVWCVAVDSKGRVVAGDSSTREVYRFDADRKPEPLTKGGIGIPWAMAFDTKGDILVCDMEIRQIVKVPEAGGEPVKVAAISGAPRGIAVDAQDRVWVVDNGGKDQVVRVLPDGTVEKVVEGRPFQMPHNIALDKAQNAYVCDNYGEKTIWKIAADSKPGDKPQKWISGKPLVGPVGISFAGERLLIADPQAKTIFEASLDGKLSPVKYEAAAK